MPDTQEFIQYLHDVPYIVTHFRYIMTKPTCYTYSDEPGGKPSSPSPPLQVSSLEWADMIAAPLGDLVQYCIWCDTIPRFHHKKLFMYKSGCCVGTRSYIDGGGSIEAALETVCCLLEHYADDIVNLHGVDDYIKQCYKVMHSARQALPSHMVDSKKNTVSIDEAAEHYGVKRRTIFTWMKECGYTHKIMNNKAVIELDRFQWALQSRGVL